MENNNNKERVLGYKTATVLDLKTLENISGGIGTNSGTLKETAFIWGADIRFDCQWD